MKHIHSIYDLYLELETRRNCEECKDVQDKVVGVLIDFVEFIEKTKEVNNAIL